MYNKPKRSVNRLLVLCASINDMTAWPFWKFLQMKKIKGVTDMAFLAFNSSGGSFEAVLNGEQYRLKNYYNVKGYKRHMLHDFLYRWHDPGRSYFIYGGHGMGDYLELERQKVGLQIHELADIFGSRKFEAVVFDACFMANLDCVYHLRKNTRYIGASEGYMWEPDSELDQHIFNTYSASVMSRFKDARHVLQTIGRHYCERCPRGDFAVLDTTHAADLRQFVQRNVIERVYKRATLYNVSQQTILEDINRRAMTYVYNKYNILEDDVGVGKFSCNRNSSILSAHNLKKDISLTVNEDGRTLNRKYPLPSITSHTRRERLEQSVHFEHALYPSEINDKHLIDLHSYLVDMAYEERVRDEKVHSDVAASTKNYAPYHKSSGSNIKALPCLTASSLSTPVGVVASTSCANNSAHTNDTSSTLFCVDSYTTNGLPACDKAEISTLDKILMNKHCDNFIKDATYDCIENSNVTSRACCVASHGTLPPLRPVPLSPQLPICSHVEKTTRERSNKRCNAHEACPCLPLFPPGSAHEGLDLFSKVVVHHMRPRASEIYASHLGGLSVTIHEFDRMSRPKESWPVSKHNELKGKIKHFLKHGSLDEVHLYPAKTLSTLSVSSRKDAEKSIEFRTTTQTGFPSNVLSKNAPASFSTPSA